MVRVLFVCLGNICRSPMGEFILKDLAASRGVADRLEVASAGTSGEEEGNPVYLPARTRDIADPWWTRDFAKAYADIAEGCAAFLDYLAREGKLA